jgi:hypothetical protein
MPGESRARNLIGEVSDPRRNVELKARDPSPEQSLQTCRSLGVEDQGLLCQRDTYFNVPRGRLKLREQCPGHPQLIQYDRTDEPQQRESRYQLAELADAAAVRDVLSASLGVRCSVIKRRRLLRSILVEARGWSEARADSQPPEQLGLLGVEVRVRDNPGLP